MNEQSRDPKQLTIQIDNRELGTFISNLLGQRRLLEKTYSSMNFKIDQNWILNLVRIIDQRVQQNGPQFISANAMFYYQSGRIVKLETRDAFESYFDNSNELSVGVDFTMAYLVKFPHGSVPEKQEIRFRIFSDRNFLDSVPTTRSSRRNSIISYEIHFTDLTWGEDLARHLNASIESALRPTLVGKLIRTMSLSRDLNFGIGMTAGMITALWQATTPSQEKKVLFEKIRHSLVDGNQETLASINEKVRLLLEMEQIREDGKRIFWIVPIMAFFILVPVLIGWLGSKFPASYVILNAFSQRKFEQTEKAIFVVKWVILAALLIGVLSSLIAARIDQYILK